MLRIVALTLAFQLASFAAEPAAETLGAGGRAAHGTLQVGIRIAAGDADSAYRTFESSLHAAMRSGSLPRDWALAASASPDPSRTIGAARFDGDLFRAAQAAPGDALVQWLVANSGDASTPENASRQAGAIDALTRIEPDNGAAWMQALAAAARHGDDAAVDDALARMGESSRFDDHFVDVVHAWIDVYDRHPPPASLSTDAYDAGFVAAFAKAAATALPAYQYVVLACKPPAENGSAFARSAPCEAAARTMLDRGDTLVARSIGFTVLRNLGAATDADRAAKRDVDWYYANISRGTGEDGDARESDWRRMDDEIAVVKSSLQRAGLPTSAPGGWMPHPHGKAIASG